MPKKNPPIIEQDINEMPDSQDMIDELSFNNQSLQQKNMELAGALTGQNYDQEDQNLIHFQLETDKILERIEHFLKGDQVKFNTKGAYFAEPTKNVLCSVKKDSKGFRYFFQEIKEQDKGKEIIKDILVKIENKDNKEVMLRETDSQLISSRIKKLELTDEGYRYAEVIDEDKKPLNEYGVAELMRIMSMYVTKETFLSNYTEERINEILGDLGDALNNFLYCNYEKMGMDTKFKESKYTLICINLLHTVESCYRRAIGGAEQENMRTRAIVTQNQGIGGLPGRPMPQKKKWNPIKPSTW